MNFCFYDTSGAITSILIASDEDTADMQGGNYLPCDSNVNDVSHYVLDGDVLTRRPYDYVLSVAGLTATLKGLPAGAVVGALGESVEADDLPTELEFELPGTYTIDIGGLVEYRDESLEVTVG